MVVAQPGLMTTADLLALPDDGKERWLVDGHLWEFGRTGMTVRNRFHSRITTNASYVLEHWRRSRPEPRGTVLSGEAGVRLSRDPETTVGIDVVYFAVANLLVQDSDTTTLVEAIPTLVIEIRSPSDTVEEIKDKIDLYQRFRVPLVWVIDPHDKTITIYRLDAEPELVNVRQELSGEPFLPGFRVPAAEIFA